MQNPYLDAESMRRQTIIDRLGEPEQPASPAQPGGRYASGRFLDPKRTGQQLANAYTGSPSPATAGPKPEAPGKATAPATTTRAFVSNPASGREMLDYYGGGYDRRNEGAGGALRGGAKGAATGASIGSAFGGVGAIPGAVIGGVAGLLGGAFTKNAKTAVSDFGVNDARTVLQNAYRDINGRDASEQEITDAIAGQGWKPGHEWVGEDGLAYILDAWTQNAESAAQAQRASAAAAPGASASAPGAGSAAAAGSARTPGPGSSRYAMEGFDLGREQDVSFSAKDAFAAAVAGAGTPPPGEDKAALGAWFQEHIAPAMEANGHTINWVDGDKMNFTSPQGTFTVDWYRGAGAPGGALAWQVEGDGAAGGAPAPAGGAAAGPGGLATGSSVQLAAGLGQSDVLQQIMAEIQRIQKGEAPRAQILDQMGA